MTPELKQYFSSLGKKGGKARASKLSKEQLHAIAMKGVEAKRLKKTMITICERCEAESSKDECPFCGHDLFAQRFRNLPPIK